MTLPHWDMTPVFPSLESEEFELAVKKALADLDALQGLYDSNKVRGGPAIPHSKELASKVSELLTAGNEFTEQVRTLYAYISSFVAVNSKDTIAQARSSEFQIKMLPLSKLSKRFTAWIGRIDVEALFEDSQTCAEHSFYLRKSARSAHHLMSEGEEDLYSELSPSGSSAWGRLHGNISSRLMVEVPGRGKLPMSAVRGLARDGDADLRRTAYEAELAAWEAVEVPLAAAMNSIKGDTNTVIRRRGWSSSLDAALESNNVDMATLEAMQVAVVESFPDFRRYLKTKARMLGKDSLPFYDLFAPVGSASQSSWNWNSSCAFILEQFGSYSPKMREMAARSFDERWVDAEPREGKSDGAFCMGLRRDESRVLMNFNESFGAVSTLAHELGHAYHNINIFHRTPSQRATPMALAETASIFCETLVVEAGLRGTDAGEKLSILESHLEGCCQVVVDIHSRFLFEKSVFDRRDARELSVDELKETMLDAQRQTYGDGLNPALLHPYMWAVKGHYYGSTFYNWPYTFGLLFATGLYAQFEQDPESFKKSYDDLLSSTGMFDAKELTSRFGFDIATPDFWRSSLDVLRGQIAEFEALAV